MTSTVPLIPPASISAVGDLITLTAEMTSEAIVPKENPLSASGAAKSCPLTVVRAYSGGKPRNATRPDLRSPSSPE